MLRCTKYNIYIIDIHDQIYREVYLYLSFICFKPYLGYIIVQLLRECVHVFVLFRGQQQTQLRVLHLNTCQLMTQLLNQLQLLLLRLIGWK